MQQSLRISNDLLHKRGYRLTRPRDVILQVLEEAHGHLSIDQILERVHRYLPRVHLTTAYRTLEVLEALGLVLKNHLPAGHVTYEVLKAKAHHHLVCRNCGIISHPDPPLSDHLYEHLQQQYQFHELTLELVATGYCEKCCKIGQCK